MNRTIELDGIVIGCGGAGAKAAIVAFDNGAKIGIVSKCRMGKAHTVMAEGGMAAAIGPQDGPEKHFADTIIGGVALNDWRKVWKLVTGGRECIEYLESQGSIFDRSDEGLVQPRAFGGHSEKRVCHVSDRTGHAIIHALKNDVLKRDIELFEKTVITSIITKNGKVAGATALHVPTGELILFKIKFAILATGGNGAIYKYTTNSKDLTGDGVYLAYETGAELMDMEMTQFHPTCMVEPEEKKGILVTEACRGEGGILINSNGERFMKTSRKPDGSPMYMGKLGQPELEPRDVVARAIEKEWEEGRGPVRLVVCKNAWRNEVKRLSISSELQALVDESKLLDDDGVHKKLASMVEQFEKFAHTDITKEGMIVRPGHHYMMGGVKTDAETCSTRIPGLYAAGEIGSGVHGANRLGGNSLTDIQVEGQLAGKSAAHYAKTTSHEGCQDEARNEFQRIESLLGGNGTKSSAIRDELRELMWENVGMKRNEAGLKKALDKIIELKKKSAGIKASGSRQGNVAWQEAIETIGMLTVAEIVVRSAMERKESRGAHFRTDYPKRKKDWVVNILCEKGPNGVLLGKRPIEPIPEHLRRLIPEERMRELYGE